jgi:hypothetical protein
VSYNLVTKKRVFGVAINFSRDMLCESQNNKKRRKKMADAKKFSEMMQKTWPYPFVLRKDVESASGGAFGADYLRTLDHRGQGPKGRFRIGNCVAYPKDEFYAWFAEKMS